MPDDADDLGLALEEESSTSVFVSVEDGLAVALDESALGWPTTHDVHVVLFDVEIVR